MKSNKKKLLKMRKKKKRPATWQKYGEKGFKCMEEPR
jgi:hypothetical protein